MPAVDCNKLDVHALRKVRIALNFRGVSLPIFGELGDEDDVVRIAHRYRDAADFARPPISSVSSRSTTGLSHFNFKFVLRSRCEKSAAQIFIPAPV